MSSGVCPRQAETNKIDDIETTHQINEVQAFASRFYCSANQAAGAVDLWCDMLINANKYSPFTRTASYTRLQLYCSSRAVKLLLPPFNVRGLC